MEVLDSSAEKIRLPAGAALLVSQFSTGASATVSLVEPVAGISFTTQTTSGATAMQVGPFASPCNLQVSAAGKVGLDVTFGVEYQPDAITTPAVGASPVAFVNTSGRPYDIVVIGGTVSIVNLTRASGGSALYPLAGPVHLDPGDTVTITYSVVPVIKQIQR